MARRDGARDRAALLAVCLLAALAVVVIRPGAGGPLASAAIWLACVAVLSRGRLRALLSLECLYLVWLGLFHLGMVVPMALGATPDPFPDWLAARDLALPLGLFNAATLAFTAGAILFVPRPPEGEERLPLAGHPPLFWIGTAVAAAGAVLFWIGVFQTNLLAGTYNEYYQRSLTEDARAFAFGFMLLPLGVVLAAVGATPRQLKLVALAYAAVVAPVFFAGFRGPVLVHAAALLAVWMRKDQRTALRVAAVTTVALVLLAPAIRAARNTGESVLRAARETRPGDFVFETGASIRPLIVTAERVSTGAEGLWMGRSYAMAATRVIPNLSSQRRLRDDYQNPNAWASMHETPYTWERGGGIGFSAVAEPYLNFGRAGVIGFFLMLGAALALGDRALSRNVYAAAVAAASFGFLLWAVRNDVTGFFRPATYAVILVACAWALAGVRRRSERIE